MIKFISLLLSQLLLSSVVASPSTTLSTRQQSAGDICRVWGQQSLMLDGWIYVDIAYVTSVDTIATGAISRFEPFTVNLRAPFDSAASINSDSDLYTVVNVTDTLPATLRGAIWADKDETIYKYGGFFLDQLSWDPQGLTQRYGPRPSEIWTLETKGFTWSKLPTPGGVPVSGSSNGGTAYTPALGLGFFSGGKLDNQTDSKFANWTGGQALLLDTMLTYDMGANSFTNTSTTVNPFFLDTLVFVPVGPEGILLSLGGYSIPNGTGFYHPSDEIKRDLRSISIYDISKQSWYTQRASGQIPSDRYAFCAAVAAASDNSSYSIIIHGGISTDDTEAFPDTYVLSLPSFEFFQVDKGEGRVHRYDHTCHLQKNKLFVLGGRDVDQGNPGWTPWQSGACDPNGFINILDVNTFTWDAKYDPKNGTEYQVHKTITDMIGGNGAGCATMRQPETGWEDAKSRLQELFAGRAGQSQCPTATGNSDHTATGAASASPSPSKPSGASWCGRIGAVDLRLYLGLFFIYVIAFI